ncbi:acyl-CoA dehydrogenase family protein [Streptomyces endophyticus]|uniref:Acyl-CoA dehydrogenase family protein n=1 Tax=Streptomyces endophyticus TaxID=714166 RepID=A0ABU6FKT9_9ACTN|nr:acyl-CoA dehydrogenase family protein [Streptomyces endophyticus]MEB8343392.1 acyl-CoA dehydrogenase family protein [Streptomyces endophyticus]
MTDVICLAESLERWLGDPERETNSTSFVRALELDEREELPAAGIDQLRAFGFHRYFVPERLGGELRSAEELLTLTRVIARRDMNVAVSESTQVWMMLVWIGGDAEQRAKYAATMVRGGVVPCLAYSEPGHGADLAANEFAAVPERIPEHIPERIPEHAPDRGADQYVLTGEKWPINRGRTSTHVVLLGTTGGDRTPAKRRQSMFLVDRAAVAAGEVTGVPRVPTYGLRGCDISGVAFEGVRVGAQERIGAEGDGLELALRGLLITRTLCTGLSLGTGDTMLRAVGDFLSRRFLYEGAASDIPYVTESLANAYLSLLVAECESLVAMRGLHLFTEEFSVWGNVSKVQVARLVDGNGRSLSRTLGARYYLRAPEHVGIFQKMLRDSAVVSVFDGSEPVCLDSIALQLPAMAKAHTRERPEEDWRALFDLRADLPPFEPDRVSVFGRGRDATFAALPELIRRLDGLRPEPGGCDEERIAALRAGAERVRHQLDALFAQVGEVRGAAARPAAGKGTPPRLIRLAEELCALHAKVAALGVWIYNRDQFGEFFADGAWLQAALDRDRVHRFEIGDLEPETAGKLFGQMNSQRENNELFSIRKVRLAEPGAHEATSERHG